jgi:hypothetical protein
MQFSLNVVVLECSFVKHSQGILGVNNNNRGSVWLGYHLFGHTN